MDVKTLLHQCSLIAKVFGKPVSKDDAGVLLETPRIGGLVVTYDTGGKFAIVYDAAGRKLFSVTRGYASWEGGAWWRHRLEQVYTIALLRHRRVRAERKTKRKDRLLDHRYVLSNPPLFGEAALRTDYLTDKQLLGGLN